MVSLKKRKKMQGISKNPIIRLSKIFLILMVLLSIVVPCSYAFDDTDITKSYEHNLDVTDVWINPGDHIATLDDSKSDIYIKNLSAQIVGNTKTDYEKFTAIYNWIAENIYYDFDAYNNPVRATEITRQDNEKFAAEGFEAVHGWYLVTGPAKTAVLRRGVCQDYFALTYYYFREKS